MTRDLLMIPKVQRVTPRRDVTLSLEMPPAPAVRGRSRVLVSVLWSVPASLMSWHMDHAILSANSSPLGGSINHSKVLKNASANWTVVCPGPSHIMEKLSGYRFCILH